MRLSRLTFTGGGGVWWIKKLRKRVTQLPTRLKLKMSLSLETTFSLGVGGVAWWLAGGNENKAIVSSKLSLKLKMSLPKL